MGMVVNAQKTNLICISDALSHRPATFIEDSDGKKIECVKEMRVLGFHFSDRPTVSQHLDKTMKKMRMRYWFLTNLRAIGFTDEELVKVYRTNIMPLADYCAPAYHLLMTDEQDQLMERTQIGALRRIFGYGKSARKLRQEAGIDTLRDRRISLTDKFAHKCLGNKRFATWFPKKTNRRSSRGGEIYVE